MGRSSSSVTSPYACLAVRESISRLHANCSLMYVPRLPQGGMSTSSTVVVLGERPTNECKGLC